MKKVRNNPVRLLLTASEAAGLIFIAWVALKHLRFPVTAPGQLVFLIIMTCGTLFMLWFVLRNSPRKGFRPRVIFYGATILLSVLSVIGPGDYTYFPGYTAVYALLGFCCLIGGSIAARYQTGK